MQLEQGQVVEGKVTSITKFGAFVQIDESTIGMVHISEVSHQFIEDITGILQVGQTVKAMVMKVAEDGKISLSIKRTEKKQRKFESKRTVAPPTRPTADSWNYNKNDNMSFEDMMSRFKQNSDDKMSDLKRKNGDVNKRRRSSNKS